ncbi:glycosyltransferase family 1 protein [Leucobacter sp. M11]|uniref:glycosyltransferase family 1 protein n=1 Tax=Leucobacter sp. M11 TaxID=2993565 RepID=UPI002D7E9291|nr:glycosyltransferase family 1 protein [Leucobacter sp. M11]MEB4615422.1 glycosyltransferase family 1 protein [Leucobacter sp. M11]
MNASKDSPRPSHRPTLLILSFSELRADARLLKQIAGFAPDFAVTTCGYGPAPDGVEEHLQLSGDHPVWAYDRLALLSKRYRAAYWGNPAIAEARTMLAGRSFDLILANDVDPAGIALELSPRFGVHMDLHEYSPRQKEDLLRWRLFVAPFIRWMIRSYVARAQSWSTVSGGLAREYQRAFGFRPELVTNASPYHDLAPGEVSRPIRLVHSGAALRDRKLEIMLDALELSSAEVTLDLFLTPNDPEYVAELRARATESTNLTVHDPVAYEELIPRLNEYDVGVFVLEPVNFSYRWALPNKLFDFVQARLGMIVGPSPEMRDMVIEHRLGAVANSFGPTDLAAEFNRLTREQVAEWQHAADRAARELSSESQVAAWRHALEVLLRKGTESERRQAERGKGK